jgi:hypothetical protein
LAAGSPTRSTQKRRSDSLIAITRDARRASPCSTYRNGPSRKRSSLCFVETTAARPAASAP